MPKMKQNEITPVINATEIIPLHKDVLVKNLYFGEQITPMGIVVMDDDKKDRGIHPRWAKIYAVGPENKDVTPGQWILIAHGRWSRGFTINSGNEEFVLRRVDPTDILLTSSIEIDPKNNCIMGK